MSLLQYENLNSFKHFVYMSFVLVFCFFNTTIFSEDSVSKVGFIGLSMFSAEYNEGEILLIWETFSEVNIYGYEIVRGDSLDRWTTIGFINGFGNSYSTNSYSFIDQNPQIQENMYFLKQIDNSGYYGYSDTISVSIATYVEYGSLISYELSQNYPNPFNPSTTISYSIPKSGEVTLSVYNSLGEKISILINEYKEAGIYTISFNGASLCSGVYFYSVQTDEFFGIRKMILLK